MTMQAIRKDIYEALMTSAVVVYPQGAADSLGDTLDGTAVTYNGYAYENTEKVLNELGAEVLSHVQIYMRGSDIHNITIHDLISCADVGVVKQRLISRQIYRGRGGGPVVGVLYLP